MKKNKLRILLISMAALVVIMSFFFPLHIQRDDGIANNLVLTLGQGQYRITIGNLVSAQDADYTCDGVDDNVQFQQAMDTLPEIGGQLFVLAGGYNFADNTTVTRAIDNISIIGVSSSVSFEGDGTTAIFTAGGNGWLLSNLEVDTGGLDMGATTDYMWLHVNVSTTYYPLRTDNINIEDHSALHGVGGADTIFPADPGADKFLMWDDDPGQFSWEDSGAGDMQTSTYDTDTDGDIDTAAGGTEWDSSAATGVAYITAGAWGTRATGITHTYILVVDGTPNSGEYARFTSSGLEGRTESELKQDFNLEIGTDVQAFDAELAALAGLTSAADKVIYFTGSGTAATSDFTSFARSIVDDADEATFKATVNLQIGTDVQAWDSDLDDIAALSDADANFIVGNGANWVVESGATVRESMGLIIGTDVQAHDDELDALAGLTSAADKVPYFTGSGTAGVADFTSYGRSLVAVADEAAFKLLVNLEIGTDVQSWDDDLDDLASLTPTDGNFIVGDGADWTSESGATAVADAGAIMDSAFELPSEHPFFPGTQFTIITDDTQHRSRGSGVAVLTDKWIIFWREAEYHDSSDYTSTIRCADSYDGGLTLDNEREVYSEANCDTTDIRVWIMDDGRIGIMAERWLSTGSGFPDYSVFIYSDDDGDTWNDEILDTGGSGHVKGNLSYDWIRYPTSVGGADDGGWIGFLHQSRLSSPAKDIYAVNTTDNGDSWDMTLVVEDTGGLMDDYDVTDEPIIQRIGSEDKWIMLLRVETGSTAIDTPLFTSIDLTSWNGPYDTGQSQRRNPSRILYHDGCVTWISATRPYHYESSTIRGLPISSSETFQGLVTQTVDAAILWGDPDCWPGWTELTRITHIHGDPSFWEIDGNWFGILGFQEGPIGIGGPTTKTYSQLAIVSSIEAGPKVSNVLPGAVFGDRIYAWNFLAKQGAIFMVGNAATSPFSGQINGAPTSTTVIYYNESNENCLKGIQTGSNRWGRFILHNTDKSNTRLIVDFDEATNEITTESSSDDWENNDNITLQSQTCTQSGYMDVDLRDELTARETVTYLHIDVLDLSSGDQSGRRVILHPYSTYNSGNRIMVTCALADEFSATTCFLPIIDQKLCVFFDDFTNAGIQVAVLATLEEG